MIAALLILIAVAAMPPMTADQQARLVVDDPAELFEGPSLRPLLENVQAWDPSGLDASDSPEPDYVGLLSDPVGSRGALYLVKGEFAGRARRFSLSQAGLWGDALTEWVLIVKDEPEQVAVVYFVDPENELRAPRIGSEVRVPARFYKVWADTDQEDRPADYLTFIARTPLDPASDDRPTRLGSALALLLGVLVLALIYVFIHRLSRSTRRRPQPRSVTPKSADDVMLSDQPDRLLPDDPAEALERLATRQDDT